MVISRSKNYVVYNDSKLTNAEKSFLKTYEIVTGGIWKEYFDNRKNPKWGGMSAKKRNEELNEMRTELDRIWHKMGRL